MSRLIITFISLTALLLGGCTINDPNHNEKIRYGMAYGHAKRVLEQSGHVLSPYDDYKAMVFYRTQWDKEIHCHCLPNTYLTKPV